MANLIVVIADARGGKVKKPTLETITAAKELAAQCGGEVQALVVGSATNELTASGVTRVIAIESPALLQYSGDGYTDDIGGLNAIHLLIDKPETYGLPVRPQLGSRATVPSQLGGVLAGALIEPDSPCTPV